jgi:dipeptidase E
MPKRLLLLSNSTNLGEPFLSYPLEQIREFLGDHTRIAFVPYAAVRITFEDYVKRVRERLQEIGVHVTGVHESNSPVDVVRGADAIMVGGGNTFHLLTHLYRHELIDAIREKVRGGAPYIGWSAGSNVACPTIKTTNDMPIVQPPSFEALNLVSFQLNPHYTDGRIPNLNGESRDDRLLEFLEVNPGIRVVGLREGTMLRVEDPSIRLIGPHLAKVFKYGVDPVELSETEFSEGSLA